MPTSVGPNTFGEENLVFGYDLGDVVNSYKGEPTTNVIAGTNLVNVVAGTFTTNTTVGGVRILENTQVDNSHVMWNGATGFTVTCSAGAYITVSAEYKTTCTIRMRFRDNPYDSQYNIDGGNIATISQVDVDIPNTQGEWVRYSATAQTSTANPDLWWYLVDYRNNNQFGRVEIRNWQIEVKSHATPYVNGTRSATQGLIDLTGNSTIDLSNVSFDSNAQMTFDGTDDYLQGASSINYPVAWTDAYTLECVIYVPSSATWSNSYISSLIMKGSYAGSHGLVRSNTDNYVSMWVRGDNGAIAASTLITRDTWVHITGVWTGTQVQIYKNGVLVETAGSTRTGIPDGGVWRIGQASAASGNVGNTFDGNIPIVKFYNRVLTASEVKSNFNAVKSRYGI